MRKKILLVDDETQIVRLLKLRLQTNNYHVVTASNCLQCVQMVREVNPDLVLLDINMHMGEGIKAFEDLQHHIHTENIPILLITTLSNREIKKQVINMGADGFISKPIDNEELMKKYN